MWQADRTTANPKGKASIDFALTGVLHGLLAPLAEEGVSVFAQSTFDTDWILVPVADADRAAEAWRRSGVEVRTHRDA